MSDKMTEQKTKQKIIDAFMQLVIQKDFYKITIQDITDQAGVVRPTFYYYFQDKYHIFEVILDDLIKKLEPLIYQGMFEEYHKIIFKHFEMHRDFYREAFKIKGQNSFENIVFDKIFQQLQRLLNSGLLKFEETLGEYTSKYIAEYSALTISYMLKVWMTDDELQEISSDKVFEAYNKFIHLSISDYYQSGL